MLNTLGDWPAFPTRHHPTTSGHHRPVLPILAAILVSGLLTMTTTVATAPPAAAVPPDDTNMLVNDGVSNRDVDTSNNIDASVWAMESEGSVLFTGGKFRTVRDRSARADVTQAYLAAFDANTGEFIPWFRPQVNGAVYDVKSMGDGRIMIAGEFTEVNGRPGTAGLAVINIADGSVDTSFQARFRGGAKPVVRSIAVTADSVFAGGGFTTYVSPDGTSRSVDGLVRLDRSTGAQNASFAPQISGGRVWGVAYNTTYDRLFVGGFFDQINGMATLGFGALEPATGANVAGFALTWPSGYANDSARLGPQIHDVETSGNRVIWTTKHHVYSVIEATTGAQVGSSPRTAGTQRVKLSVDGTHAYVGCHCDGKGYLRAVNLATGSTVGIYLSKVNGTAGVWAAEELPNGCVWTGGGLSRDTSASRAVPNMLRICETASPSALTGGLAAPQADPSPPSSPGVPELRQFGASVELTWTRSIDDSGQPTYIIYRDGVEVGRSGSNTFADLLVAQGVHQWSVAAVDPSGNLSARSSRSTPLEIGPPVEIVRGRSFQASPGANGTTPAAMNDGDLTTYWFPERQLDPEFFWQVDLGSSTAIDYVLIHESDVVTHSLGLAAAAVKLSNSTFPDTRDESLASRSAFAALRVDRYYKPEVRLDVGAMARSIRLDAYANYGQAIDEFQVFTTQALPTPAAPAADTTRPAAPRWKRVRLLNEQPVLEWGGATDDQGVIQYEIWRDGNLLGTTTLTVFPVASASEKSGSYEIVAVDAAGNGSLIKLYNAAKGKPARQVSTQNIGSADKGVDGNTSGVWGDASITHTTLVAQPWWEVDLGASTDLDSVVLWNRTDCCGSRLSGVNVFVSESPMSDSASVAELAADPAVTHYDLGPDALGPKTTVTLTGTGRYVRVKLSGTGYLSLAEVEVMTGSEPEAADTIRPSVPRDLVVVSVDGAASLTWSPATDNVGVTGYQVFRTDPDGTETMVGTPATESYVDDTVTVGQTYQYHLKAFDAAGNTSWRSGKKSVTITEPAGPPAASCSITRDGTSIEVTWSHEPQPDEIVIERSVNGGNFWWRGKVPYGDLSFTDTDVAGDVTYRTVPKTGNTKGDPITCTE